MKTRVRRFSPHQNAKVFAVLMAVVSTIFLVPFILIANVAAPAGERMPVWMALLFPIIYLVFGYISVAAGCWAYNVLAKYTGGLEFEADNV